MKMSNKKDVRKRVNTDKQREQQRKRMIECRENRKRQRKKKVKRKIRKHSEIPRREENES